jgi:hypothetical protein
VGRGRRLVMSTYQFNALAPGKSPIARDRPPDGWRLDAPHSSPLARNQPGSATGGPARFQHGLVSPVRAFDVGATPIVGNDDDSETPVAGLQEMQRRGLGRSRIRSLDLSRLEMYTPQVEKMSQAMTCMYSLQKLAFVCCALRGEDARVLSECLQRLPRLRELELGRNRLLDLGVTELSKVLPRLSKLEWLGLGENGIGPQGARALGGGGFWEGGLNIGHDVGLPGMLSLRRLEMAKNRLGDEGAKHLAAGIAKSSTLTSLTWLSLDSNRLEDAGCVAVLLAATKLAGLQLLALSKEPNEVDFEAHLDCRLPRVTTDKGWAACVMYLRYFEEVWARYPGLLSPSQVKSARHRATVRAQQDAHFIADFHCLLACWTRRLSLVHLSTPCNHLGVPCAFVLCTSPHLAPAELHPSLLAILSTRSHCSLQVSRPSPAHARAAPHTHHTPRTPSPRRQTPTPTHLSIPNTAAICTF